MTGPIIFTLVGVVSMFSSASRSENIEAITKPSEDLKLPFVLRGRVAQVMVKEGDKVEPNQVLMVQDDTAEQIQLEQLKAKSEDTTGIKFYAAQTEVKQAFLKRLKEVPTTATTPTEVEQAGLDVKVADLQRQIQEFEHQQDIRKYNEYVAQLERMKLRSPISGRVEQVALQAGEAVEAVTPVIRLVKINPLWIDVPVPLAQTAPLKAGGTAMVDFSPVGGAVVEGKIINIAAVVDAASNTRTVRVEAPNSEERPAGERVNVIFPPSQVAGATSQPVTRPATQEPTEPEKKE